ncbi:MAG: DUF309 domain-containing protein [Verrucomicrobia bacterium]|nr:DUF309 domain-containing protein [Verrucomicrobiota bacterium]
MAKLLAGLAAENDEVVLDPRYAGYFALFNAREYYEAHDVLEDLWLASRDQPDALFYKGLIQLAGAFVHLQKGRLSPAARLFALAQKNLSLYPDQHHQLAVGQVCHLCDRLRRGLEASNFRVNPWTAASAPRLDLAATPD